MIRLRQVALVARDLDAVVGELCEHLGLTVCFHDPGVAAFGLRNALMMIGDQFLEVVSPTQPGTTAGRLLDKRNGDGGYMAIYEVDDLDSIVGRTAEILGVPIDGDGRREIASRSRGTPRIANRLLRRVRDFAEVRAEGVVDAPTAHAGLALFGVDALGLELSPNCVGRGVIADHGHARRTQAEPGEGDRGVRGAAPRREPHVIHIHFGRVVEGQQAGAVHDILRCDDLGQIGAHEDVLRGPAKGDHVIATPGGRRDGTRCLGHRGTVRSV